MKILIHDFGGFPFIIRLAEHLASAGHDVTCLFANLLATARCEGRDNQAGNPTFINQPVSTKYRVDKGNLVKRLAHEVRYGREAARTVRESGADLVISSNTPTHAQYFIQRACLRRNIRFIYWIQDFYSLAVGSHLSGRLPVVGRGLSHGYQNLEKRLYRKSDWVVPIAESFIPRLRKWGIPENRIKVIHNWAPIEEIPVLPKDNTWAREQDLADKFCFLYAGTLGTKHNPELFLQLAQRFKDQPDVRTVVVAEGPGVDILRQASKQASADNLVILPLQPESVYPQVLATGNVLMAVLEDDAGNFSVPSKVLSYLCAGRPVLLSAPLDNLAARIIRETKAGLCASSKNSRRFLENAECLEKAQLQTLAARGLRARRYAEHNFRRDHVVEQFNQLIDSV